MLDDLAQQIPVIDVKGNVENDINEQVKNIPATKIIELTTKFNNSKNLKKLYGTAENYIRENSKTFTQGLREDFSGVFNVFANAPGSAVKTATTIGRAVTNPLDTFQGLRTLVSTPEGKQALIDRYGSRDNFQKTMETDPVGLATDILTIVE